MKTIKKKLMSILLFSFILFSSTTTFIYCLSGLPWPANTHGKITDDSIETSFISASEYPDLYRFQDKLIDGSNCEPHNPPGVPGTPCDNSYHRWWPVYENWFSYGANNSKDAYNKASALYWYCQEYNFTQAYTNIGHMLHNVQDTTVPSHINQCIHGVLFGNLVDGLEGYAISYHGYDFTHVNPTFNHMEQSWSFWLSDTADDDDENNTPDGVLGGSEANDHNGSFEACWDIPANEFGSYGWGVKRLTWTYPEPGYYDYIEDTLPGLNKGHDAFGNFISGPDSSSKWTDITHEVLSQARNDTVTKLKEKSKALPPIIPNGSPYTAPSITESIFGPNKSVGISFMALENRLKTVKVTILAGSTAIKDTSGKDWDGGDTATYDLSSNETSGHLPWESTITKTWLGQLKTGYYLSDGQHSIKIKVKDGDSHDSQERTLSVKYDKTKPTGSITVSTF